MPVSPTIEHVYVVVRIDSPMPFDTSTPASVLGKVFSDPGAAALGFQAFTSHVSRIDGRAVVTEDAAAELERGGTITFGRFTVGRVQVRA